MFLDQGDLTRAERCLNNASEHYIKLGNESAEAAVLRLLATVYDTRHDLVSARRCLERVVALDQRYALPELQTDSTYLEKLKQSVSRSFALLSIPEQTPPTVQHSFTFHQDESGIFLDRT